MQTKPIEARQTRSFQMAIEAAADAIVLIDRQGVIVRTNTKADDLFGYQQGELASRMFEILAPQRFRKAYFAQREAFFAGPDEQGPMGSGQEHWGQRKDGAEFPLEITLTRIHLEDGLFIVAAIDDITERKAFEQKLRDSEERLSLLIQNVREYALFLHDPEGRITVWNEGAERIMGYSAQEIIGRTYLPFYTPEDIASGRPERDLTAAVEHGSYQSDAWRVKKDGSRFIANIVITPVYGRDGKLVGYAKVIRDLTTMRQSQDALRDASARLRRTVAELEGLVYTASHDLRGPLRAIQGYAHFAEQRLKDRADQESLRMLQRISDSAIRLDEMIKDVLSYSAISRDEVTLAPVDLDKIFDYVVGLYPNLAHARLTVRAPLGEVMAQESLMVQIASNLLTNAVKFTPPDRAPEIIVWTEEQEGEKVRLIVQDNGPGIAHAHLSRIFEPFMRLPGARGIRGRGIGLAIVKRAVERLGGEIGVDSEPGKGSRFSVTLGGCGRAR